jgi:hypothetical protein
MRFHHTPLSSVRPRLEALEDRTLPSAYLVDRLTDAGQGSGLAGDLRYCLIQAQNGDRIGFADGLTGTINLTGPLPNLTRSVSIDGPGANLLTLRRDTGGDYRILQVTGGASVSLSGLTIANGYLASSGGSGIYVNQASLSADGIVLTGNGSIDPVNGGALLADTATVTIRNSAIVNNRSAGVGGGVYIYFGGNLTLEDTTLSGNTAAGWDGGAIWDYGVLTMRNCTVSGNSAVHGGGIAVRQLGTVSLLNTIVAGNTATVSDPDVSGTLTTSGHNLIGNTQGGFGFAATDLLNVDPLLGPLQDNGGPTPTQALLAGSPALNAGSADLTLSTDQRGVVRRGGVNLGAFQASATQFVFSGLPDRASAGQALPFTVTALDPFGQLAVGYRGTVTFASSDDQASLPADHAFSADDGGSFTFADGVTFASPADRTLTVRDLADSRLTATATVLSNPAVAYFEVTVAGPVTAGQAFQLTVTARDADGNVVTGYAGRIGLWSLFGQDDLRAGYTFTAADAGSHTVSLTLSTPGDVGIVVADTESLAIGFVWVTVGQGG